MSAANRYDRYRRLVKSRPLPLAMVDLDAFDRNVAVVAATQRKSGKTVRVASKSLRCTALIRRVMDLGGPAFQGIMAFTVPEAEFLVRNGFDDMLVAYPTVQPSDLAVLADLHREGHTICLVVDCRRHLEALDDAGRRAGVRLRACLEIDMAYRPLAAAVHLGVRRSPIRSPQQAADLARWVTALPGVRIDGVMGYEAQVASVNDDLPGHALMNRLVRWIKRRSVAELTRRRAAVVGALGQTGATLRLVNGGGSGSLASTAADPAVTEVTAGSAFFAPALFHHFRDVKFTPAAFFALQVVRRPAPRIITCQGGGYVASGQVGPDRLPRPVLPPGAAFLKMEAAGEVQTPLTFPAGARLPAIGDPVFFQHAKAGELCERFNTLLLIQGPQAVGEVPTYRGQGQSFL